MKSSESREEAICRLHQAGNSIAKIRRLTGIRFERVKYVIEYWEENHEVAPPTVRGRRPLTTNDKLLTVRDENIDDEPLEYRSQRSWTPHEDEILIQKFNLIGKRWSVIARFIPDRTPSSVRNRFMALYKKYDIS